MTPQLWPITTPGDHNLNKIESTPPVDASTSAFPSRMVFEKKI